MPCITFELGKHKLEDVKRELFLAAYDECKDLRRPLFKVSQMLGISHKQAYIWRDKYRLLLGELDVPTSAKPVVAPVTPAAGARESLWL